MRAVFKVILPVVIAARLLQTLHTRELVPRAYIITPLHSSAIILTYSFSQGGVLFDNAVPITDATAIPAPPDASMPSTYPLWDVYWHALYTVQESLRRIIPLTGERSRLSRFVRLDSRDPGD